MHRYSILFQEINEPGFPKGWYYAHVPALNLTTHGEGLEGARQAALDLIQLWFAEKRAQGEAIPQESTVFFSQIEIPDAVQSL
ncbi:MAG: type II toxin-antitoxin system HicB family antitoxin [Spirochaetota bacterium]